MGTYPKGVAYNDFTRGLEALLDHVLGSERVPDEPYATRYDKDPANYLAAVKLVATRIWCQP